MVGVDNEKVLRGVKRITAQFLVDCIHQARMRGNHPLAPVQIDSTLLYAEKYVQAGVGLDSSLRRGVQSMGKQCVSWEGFLVPDVHGMRQRLIDCLWSVSCNPEDSRYSGPYDETLEVFSPEVEVPLEKINHFLSRLHPREEMVIRMRFGIGMRSDYTLEEVGEQMRITRERVRQIETKGMLKLSSELRAFAHQEASLFTLGKAAVEQKAAQDQEGLVVQYRKRLTNPVRRVQQAILQHESFTQEERKLIGQLNGWFGYMRTTFAKVATARKQSWAELATQANNLSRRMRHLGVWVDAPVYRMEEEIIWPEN
jgi:hypothetical protein